MKTGGTEHSIQFEFGCSEEAYGTVELGARSVLVENTNKCEAWKGKKYSLRVCKGIRTKK